MDNNNQTIMYTIESISEEGVYYLVNGWDKHNAFWSSWEDVKRETCFKREQDAKRSLTMLLKIMEDYKTDTFGLCTVYFNGDNKALNVRGM